jgi:hypothetical protein
MPMRNRMRWTAMVTAVAAAAAVLAAPGTGASTQLGCRWPDAPVGPTSIRYSAADEPAALQQVWASAAQRWSSSGGNVAFVEDPIAYTVTADSADFGNVGFDGLIQYTCVAGFFVPRLVRVGLNTFYTDSYPTGMRLSVAGHELGHTTGLGHEDRTDCRARPLMFSSSARWTQCGIEAPTADDTAGTRGLYP